MARFTAVAVAMLVVLAAGVWLFWYGVGLVMVPAGGQTELRMGRLGGAVLEFARKNDRLPGVLGELGVDPVDGKPFILTDVWGGAILYEVVGAGGEGIVRLTSLGADGKVGGEGEARDLVWERAMRDPRGGSGGWVAVPMEVEEWRRVKMRAAGVTTGPTTVP